MKRTIKSHSINALSGLIAISLIAISLIAGLCRMPLKSQDLNPLLRLARQYEEAGRWQDARQIYESLLAGDPDNILLYENLKEVYLRTFDYEKARLLIQRRLDRNPDQPGLEVDLAQILYRMGEEKKALSRFDAILDKYRDMSSVYSMVASAFVSERLYDRAIAAYLAGRRQLNHASVYAINLSQLYAATQDFGKASGELLLYFQENPNRLQQVKQQYLQFPKSERILKQLAGPVQKALDAAPMNLDYYVLLALLYEHHESYEEALKINMLLETRMPEKEQGMVLFRFASDVFIAGQVTEAKAAYEKILTTYPHFQGMDQVLFGLAKCYESEQKPEQAIAMYQRIIDAYSNRHLSKIAALRMGGIQRDVLFQPEVSLKTFENVIRQFPGTPEAWTAELELAQSRLLTGKPDTAIPLLKANVHRKHPLQPGHHLQAMYQMAQIVYFKRDYTQALAWLDTLSSEKWQSDSFQHPVVNDGLQLRFFIQQYYRTQPAALHVLSRADYLTFQHRYSSASSVLDSLLTGEISKPVQGDALFKRGTLAMLQDKPERALKDFQILTDRLPRHILADSALERCGYLYEKMKNREKAIEQYEKLLTDYPHSMYVNEIRKRIRLLEVNS